MSNFAKALTDPNPIYQDPAKAKEYYERALLIRQKLAPGSTAVADSLNNLGFVAHDQGDLAKAKEYYERALAIREKLAPGSYHHAGTLVNLGNVAADQGDLAGARALYERAVRVADVALGPDHLELGLGLSRLAEVLRQAPDSFISCPPTIRSCCRSARASQIGTSL